MDRSGLYLMVLGFLLSWPVPVAGVVVMVLGALATAIVMERTLLPELSTTEGSMSSPGSPRPPAGPESHA